MAVNKRFYKDALAHGREKVFAKHRGKTITDDDEKIIREYINEVANSGQGGEMWQDQMAIVLCNWRRFIPHEYRGIRIEDVYTGISKIKNGVSERGEPYKVNTLHSKIKILKRFLFWLAENKKAKLPEKKLKAIKVPGADEDTKQADDLPTTDEIKQIIKNCVNNRQRAFASLLYETGARVGEIGRMTWKDLKFEKIGDYNTIAVIINDEKTDTKRYSRITSFTEHIANYKSELPEIHEDDFVFKTRDGEPMTYQACRELFARIMRRSGLKKHVSLHDLRRARATHMVQQNYNSEKIKKSLWGNINTPQFRRYVKLGQKDIDKEFLDKAGIMPDEDGRRINPMAPIPCPTCTHVNAADSKFCPKCGTPLTEAAKAETDKLESKAYEYLLQRIEALEKGQQK